MTGMSAWRCCWRCGRWGTRSFAWNHEKELPQCSNDAACRRRVDRATAEREQASQAVREYEVWSTYKVDGVAYVRARSAKEAIEKALDADACGVEIIYGEPYSETKMRARRVDRPR